MKEVSLSQKLQKMYDDQVYEKGFCEYQNDCIEGLRDKRVKFRFDRVKLGERYGKDPRLPKIVCVGLEGKHDKCENLIVQKEIDNPSNTVWNAHYVGVRYVLAYLLSSFEGKEKPENKFKYTLNNYQDTIKCYALTNIYKCAFGDPNQSSGLEHSAAMCINCQKILFREIDILQPDVLIIQAVDNLPTNFWKNIIKRYGGSKTPVKGDENKNNTSVYELKYNSGKRFLLVRTYHGNAWRFRGKNYLKQTLNPVLEATLKKLKEYGFNAD